MYENAYLYGQNYVSHYSKLFDNSDLQTFNILLRAIFDIKL